MRLWTALVLAVVACAGRPAASTLLGTSAPHFEVAGLKVLNDSEHPVDVEEFAQVVEETLRIWDGAMLMENFDCFPGAAIKGAWVVFRDRGEILTRDGEVWRGPDGAPILGVARLDLSPPVLEVVLRGEVRDSSLAHELGHLIEWRCTGDSDNGSLRRWHEKFSTPY